MNLHYTLPDALAAFLAAFTDGEPLEYCVPYDVDASGEMCCDGFVAVTRRELFVLAGETLCDRVPLSEGTEIACSVQVDSGLLTAKTTDGERILCRFSMRHMIRQSYVARGATALAKGKKQRMESRERETTCPVCGHALPGTDVCPHCHGKSTTWKRLLRLCKPYIPQLSLITVLMMCLALIAVVQQFVQRHLIDNVLIPANGGVGDIVWFFLIMAGMTLAHVALMIGTYLWSNRLGTRMTRDLRATVFEKINSLSMSFIHERQAGELMNRVVEDTARVREFMEQVFAVMFSQIFTMICTLVIMFWMSPGVTLLALAFAPMAMIINRLFRRNIHRLYRQQWRVDDRVNSRLQDIISGIRVVKAFGQEEREIRRFCEQTERLRDVQSRNERFWATLYPFITLAVTSGTYLVMYFTGTQTLAGEMTPGTMIQLMAYVSMLYGPLNNLSRLPRMIMRLTTGLDRIYDILDEQPDIGDVENAREIEIHGDVEFDRVSFGYKSYEPVLEDVSLSVKQGEMIGLVGSSGAGKSTLINLLMRLYAPDEGEIRIDGIPLSEIAGENLHSQIGVVLQETFLFSGTVFDNIRFARPEATQEEVIRAAKMANAHEFISKLPDGYDTYVGERGYTLSGGERQRVAIARAILHAPRLLILDEATSSLDTETEYQIQTAMERLTKGRTTFAIAHRLSTLRGADRIVVIDKHRIAEVGTHNALMRQKGIYYGLVMAQLEMHRVRKSE